MGWHAGLSRAEDCNAVFGPVVVAASSLADCTLSEQVAVHRTLLLRLLLQMMQTAVTDSLLDTHPVAAAQVPQGSLG